MDLHAVPAGRARDLCDVALVLAQQRDELGPARIVVVGGGVVGRVGGGLAQRLGEVAAADRTARGEGRRDGEARLELAHVERPVVGGEGARRVRRQRGGGAERRARQQGR